MEYISGPPKRSSNHLGALRNNQTTAMLRGLLLLSALLCSCLAQDSTLLARFGNFLQLRSSPAYELYWMVNGNRINFAVRVQTRGWVGFGLSPNGLMLASDVVMGYVDDSNSVVALTVSVLMTLWLPLIVLAFAHSKITNRQNAAANS